MSIVGVADIVTGRPPAARARSGGHHRQQFCCHGMVDGRVHAGGDTAVLGRGVVCARPGTKGEADRATTQDRVLVVRPATGGHYQGGAVAVRDNKRSVWVVQAHGRYC